MLQTCSRAAAIARGKGLAVWRDRSLTLPKMKKIIIRIVLVLVLLLVVGVGVLLLGLNSVFKKGFNTVGPSLTKVDTRISGAAISPFSGSGELMDLFIGNPAGYKTPSAIEAKNIKVSVTPGSVFADKMVINQVSVTGPKITFEGGLTQNNLSTILASIQEASGSSGGKDSSTPSKSKKLQVTDFQIKDAVVQINFDKLGGKSLTVPLPEIHLQNLGTGPDGITPAGLAEEILKSVVAGVTKAASKALMDLGPGALDLGKSGAGQLKNAAKGFKDLLKP